MDFGTGRGPRPHPAMDVLDFLRHGPFCKDTIAAEMIWVYILNRHK
jgi:hypothetical protein